MSHTYETNDTVFIHNSDLSGDVTIRRGDREIAVPGVALLGFIAQYVRLERTANLEEISDRKILGLP